MARAVAAYNDRRLDEALDQAKMATRQEPDNPDAHFLLGQLYYLRQELTKAKESWERALALAPSRADLHERLERLALERPLEADLARADTHPFVVRFAEKAAGVDLGSVRQLLRDTYRQVGQSFGYFPDYPIAVLLYPESDFNQVKGLSHEALGLFDGKIRLPLKGAKLKRVLWHEYTHLVVHDLSKGRCPLWLNEGIATVQEARVEAFPLTEVKKALKQGVAFPWEWLWSQQGYPGEALPLYYQQSYLIVRYLVKRFGWKGMVRVLERLGSGQPISEALQAQYKERPKELERKWLSWAKRGIL